MKLCEKLASTGCVWGTHDPVVGVAFIVVTIICGVCGIMFRIILALFWYFFGIMSGNICGIILVLCLA